MHSKTVESVFKLTFFCLADFVHTWLLKGGTWRVALAPYKQADIANTFAVCMQLQSASILVASFLAITSRFCSSEDFLFHHSSFTCLTLFLPSLHKLIHNVSSDHWLADQQSKQAAECGCNVDAFSNSHFHSHVRPSLVGLLLEELCKCFFLFVIHLNLFDVDIFLWHAWLIQTVLFSSQNFVKFVVFERSLPNQIK